MPKRYEAIKKSLRKQKGLKGQALKTAAARIFNATRKSNERPVTGPHKKKKH